jgi:mannose-6-phosphate isomerase-like protein (cupin superfamily)
MNVPSASDVIRVGQIEIRYLLEGSATDGALAMFEAVIPAQARVPVPHFHVAYDETVYGLSGSATFVVDGREVVLGRGETLFIRRGAVHQFQNRGTEPARFLATITPGILESDFFREIGAAVGAGGPPDARRLGEIMLRHGLQPVPSP